MQQPILMDINQTVFLKEDAVVMVDRRYLPHKIVEVTCNNYEDVAWAIEQMVVQGAGDIAIAAGYGLYLAAIDIEKNKSDHISDVRASLWSVKKRLINTRPTGYHLKALLDKTFDSVNWEDDIASQILNSIEKAISKQQNRSRLTGKVAERLLENGDTLLTHCFPGPALLYMLMFAKKNNKTINVIATETRPYLQGARLTAWSVSEMGISVALITDNMAAYCMSQEMITKVFTAADRVAMDGTVANKVGTFQLALAAKYHQIPFYVLGYGGPDSTCLSGNSIKIESRDPEEVLTFKGSKITGDEVEGIYPAFDLTPASLINGIITDRGMLNPGEIGRYWNIPKIG
ncbi:S-methyl-5-thioribose-1-phosphate isomerase [Candidatus Syntrophocurvum alkaliphilum]|uniref:S-methyl-5-thioribose-1-phosphate isomerase n=1 Tax=Candidatus Syntrophocurvum alkaliphilum TaxID=2293317 RepID=A0A6I6DED1_9FIRM|nr:s-methyl-5-thioribose-1-phosphate isomerase [Candidatus Syntrophocurvum alkaliphilum]QGT98918.1 S-methyl-5-thioribose-1-phosphate isomerase [Candidatus Syntrophocurvum alkaliphilum]